MVLLTRLNEIPHQGRVAASKDLIATLKLSAPRKILLAFFNEPVNEIKPEEKIGPRLFLDITFFARLAAATFRHISVDSGPRNRMLPIAVLSISTRGLE